MRNEGIVYRFISYHQSEIYPIRSVELFSIDNDLIILRSRD
jgi:hypothetical protein